MTEAIQTIEAAAGTLSASELGEVFSAFNEVTSRLQETHERLTGEVVRLKSELKRANDELDRSRRLAALGEMAAGIAHEVRNPLGSIGLYAEMLIADLRAQPSERETAEKIKRAVSGLDSVVGDVLTFSRTMEIRRVEVSIEDAVERAVSSSADVLAGCEVACIPSEDAESIEADASLLQQALVNVIRNGAEAAASNTERPASVSIAWEMVRKDEDAEESVCIRVSDSGAGITDDVRERMFNPFFTTRHIGTGLGLAIVHRIIDAHAGQVRVRNAGAEEPCPGGAVVEFILPKNIVRTFNQSRSELAPSGEVRSRA